MTTRLALVLVLCVIGLSSAALAYFDSWSPRDGLTPSVATCRIASSSRDDSQSIPTASALGTSAIDPLRGPSHGAILMVDNAPTTSASLRPRPPRSLSNFFELPPAGQLNAVTALQENCHLSKEVIDFFRSELTDRGLDATTKNNIANGLLRQVPPIPDLSTIFIAVINDREEAYQWREYSVQQLAQTAYNSRDPQSIASVLFAIMHHGERGVPGTAMIQLARLEGDGLIHLDDSYIQCLRTSVQDSNSDLLTRMSALALLGERRDLGSLPLVRLLATSKTPALRRIAIADLGQIGCLDDQRLLEEARSDRDPTIASAAVAACARLVHGETSLQTP